MKTGNRITFPVGPLQCNCSILFCDKTKKAIVIDPGDEFEKINAAIQKQGMEVAYAFHTHAHFDHCGATADLKGLHPNMKIALHKADHAIYENLPLQGQMFGFPLKKPKAVDHFVTDEETFKVGEMEFQVLHTPGHSPGGVCLHFKEGQLAETPVVFSGDTLFDKSIGRTDLWEGDHKQLIKSIKNRLLTLDDQTYVMPGHGPATTIGEEAHDNPFLR